MNETSVAHMPALTPPAPVPPVKTENAGQMVQLDPAILLDLDDQAEQFINDTLTLERHDPVFKERIESIHRLGNSDILNSAAMSNRMLDRPVKLLNNGLFNDKSIIGKSLVDLRRKIDDLNPATQGDLFKPRKILGLIPFGNKVEDYFNKYRSAQSHINGILEGLEESKDELLRDNAAIEQEKTELWKSMQRVEQYVYIGRKLDEKLSMCIEDIERNDPDKAKIVKDELLFYTRQKTIDLLTQQSVSIQGYLVLDLIRKNNLELIKGVDRASTTTMSALRTAVMTAQALNNQSLVLEQIKALNATTEDIIVATSEMLKNQSTTIHQQASGSMIDIEKLQQAFDNVFATMDMISDYKIKALDNMKQTVETLSQQIDHSQKYLDQVRESEARGATRLSQTLEHVVKI
jgi:uncharacterized protein YaaN involved in tellurite resistance